VTGTALRIGGIESDLKKHGSGSELWSYAEYRTEGKTRLTTPRSVAVDGEPADALSKLFHELVEITP
jgi:hypothetical protein